MKKIKEFVKKYLKLAIVLVVGVLIGLFVCSGKANAGGLNVFEVGVSGESDFTEIQETSTSDMTIYSFGEVDFDIALIDYSLKTGFEGGEYNKTLEGTVGVYARLYTVKGDSFEFLAGVEQPVLMSDEVTAFSDTRVWKLRVRKPY